METREAKHIMKKSNIKFLFFLIILFTFIQSFSHGFYSYYFLNIRKIDFNVFTFSKSIWFLIVILLEIPSGYLSDKWSKKNIFIFSNILMLLSFFFYSISFRGNNNFLIGEIFSASSTALSSGTLDAIIFNEIKGIKVFKDIEISQTIVQMVNVLLGIYMSNLLGYKIWYIPSVVTIVIITLSLFLINDNKVLKNNDNIRNDFKKIVKLLKNKTLIFWITSNVLIFALAQRVFNYWQSYISIITKNAFLIPIFSFLIFFFQYLGNVYSEKIKNIFHKGILLLVLCSIMILSIFKNPIFTLIGIYIAQFIRGAIIPGVSFQINSLVPNDYRSTFLSINSLIRSIGSFIMMSLIIPYIGFKKIDTMLLNSTWVGMMFFFTILFLFWIFIFNKHREEKN